MITPKYLVADRKKELFIAQSLTGQAADTGSVESQVALFSMRIAHLTTHLKVQKKDHATRLSLLLLVGKRRRLLNYLSRKDVQRYRNLLLKLGLRR